MAIEAKEVLEFLGYKPEDIKDLSDLKTKFDSEFIRQSLINEDSEPVKKIIGKTYGTLENELKKVAKGFELDIDFEGDEFKSNKKVTDKFKFLLSKYDEKKKTVIDELTTKVGQGNDEKIKEYQSQLEKEKNKRKEIESLLTATKTDFETFKLTKETEIKNTKLNVHKKDIYGKAKFIPEANEFTKKGFLSEFEEKYSLDLDENEDPIIIDKKTGKRIVSTKVAGAFKTPYEVIEEDLAKANLLQINKDGGKLKPNPVVVPPQTNQQTQINTRRVATPLP